jgi:hypothetical protein
VSKISNMVGPGSPGPCEPSSCEACGETFACGAKLTGCWCTEVKLDERLRTQLRARYQHCLCRSCLEKFAETDGGEDCTADELAVN